MSLSVGRNPMRPFDPSRDDREQEREPPGLTGYRLIASAICISDMPFCPCPDMHDCWKFPCQLCGKQTEQALFNVPLSQNLDLIQDSLSGISNLHHAIVPR